MNDEILEDSVDKIDNLGYCKIPQVFSAQQVKEMLGLCVYWYEKSKDSIADDLPSLAQNDPFVWNPQNKDIRFLRMMFYSPLVENILKHFLNDKWFKQIPQDKPNYILRNLLARSSNRQLPMHIDSLVPYAGRYPFVMQVSMLLEDQTVENGCTMIVPGSHKSGEYADQKAFEISIPLEGKAGDVVIWDSRIWHGAGENKAGGTRWALIATYSRWWLKQMFDITANLPNEIYQQLSDSEKAVLGFCSMPHQNEASGVDMKRGYESLLPNVSGYR